MSALPPIVMFNTRARGGAAVAARRILSDLRTRGVDSLLYTAQIAVAAPGLRLALPEVAETEHSSLAGLQRSEDEQRTRMRHYPRRDPRREIFTFLTACAPVDKLDIDSQAIVHLHWIARMTDPALCPDFFQRHAVVWTMHDMQPFTGGCHHADECRKFTEHCGACPHLGSTDEKDDSFTAWRQRKSVYRRMQMHAVCPSRWLAEQAAASSLLQHATISVIANSVPVNIYRPLDRAAMRRALELADEDMVLLFNACNIAHPRKGGMALLHAMRKLAAMPEGKNTRVLLLGDNPSPELLETGLRVDVLGYIDNEEHMAAVYNMADALLLPSMAENLPNVIAESLACGTPAIAFAVGGIPEMIDHGSTGFLAPPGDVDALLAGVRWAEDARKNPALRRLCRAVALERWSPAHTATAYVRVYEEEADKAKERVDYRIPNV